MLKIAHQINSSKLLQQIPLSMGVEVDLRSNSGELILAHDPFTSGESFKQWLMGYRHKTLILNVKEEGLELEAKKIIARAGIKDYFFLDQSFPFLCKLSAELERNSAIRFSEFESIDTVIKSAKFAKWVWIDCFQSYPLNVQTYETIRRQNLKICMVSPELHGREPTAEVEDFKNNVIREKFQIDAVCTKQPELWRF